MIRRVPRELWHIVASLAPLAVPLLARASREFWARFRDDPGVWRALLAEALSTSAGVVAVRPWHLELTRRMPALRLMGPSLTPVVFASHTMVYWMAASRDGKRLAYQSDTCVFIANPETGEPLERMDLSQPMGIAYMQFTHNALVVAYGNDECVRFANGLVNAVKFPQSVVLGVLYDGTYVTKRDGEVWLHGTDVHAPEATDWAIAGDTVALLRVGRVDILRRNEGVKHINVPTQIHTVHLSPSGTLLCADGDLCVQIINVDSCELLYTYADYFNTSYISCISDGGKMCIYDMDGRIVIYDGRAARGAVADVTRAVWAGEALYFTAAEDLFAATFCELTPRHRFCTYVYRC